MSTTLIKIDGKTYKQSDLSMVSALVILRASEELPSLGLRITWGELVSILKRTIVKDAEFTETEQVWLTVLTVWMTLNAAGVECSLLDAMGKTDVIELMTVPDDHKGKARAPQTRQGSGRGGVRPAVKSKPRTGSPTKS
ncbi:MAG: hypothetical protein HY829_10480 [Actinobacteria bacterium]|nr:hypothetical protein [Actinomycetota bacterium]